MIEISIIIPTLNRAILLDMALEAITKQTFQQKKFEIIVVDNGSSDTTKKTSEKLISDHTFSLLIDQI